jgi:hypothetical protein
MSLQSLPDQTAVPYNRWQVTRGVIWAGVSVAILSGWFVVTRLGLRHELRIWDVIALRFGEGALFLTPALLVGPSRLPPLAWIQGLLHAGLWGASLRLESSSSPPTDNP